MKVIALSGKSGTGKTTTLGMLHEVLTQKKGYTSLLKQAKQSNDTPTTVRINKHSENDFIDIYEKELSSEYSKKVKVGLMTEGDYVWKIAYTLKYFLNEKCDYVILASRICGNYSMELAEENGYFIHIHKKSADDTNNDKVLKLFNNLIP